MFQATPVARGGGVFRHVMSMFQRVEESGVVAASPDSKQVPLRTPAGRRARTSARRLAGQTSQTPCAQGVDLRGLPLIYCARVGQRSDVIVNIYWARPVLPRQGGCPRALRARSRRGARCGGAVELVPESTYSSVADRVSLSEEVHCSDAGDCWSLSDFFQARGGRVYVVSACTETLACFVSS